MTPASAPNRILLASDMSARCDRALDRAALLANQWNCELLVVHAVDPTDPGRAERSTRAVPSWRRDEPWQVKVERRLKRDLLHDGVAATVLVTEGSPASAVLDAAKRQSVALLITGTARDEPTSYVRLGSTVERLVREAGVPVLTVRHRVRAPYQRVVVASDLSDASRAALVVASRWFAGAALTLFHGYYAPGGLFDGGPDADDSWRASAQAQCSRFLTETGMDQDRSPPLDVVIERGPPEVLLPDYVETRDVDLVVLGTHGRGGIAKALLGSTAENLLYSLACDTMIVRSRS